MSTKQADKRAWRGVSVKLSCICYSVHFLFAHPPLTAAEAQPDGKFKQKVFGTFVPVGYSISE